MYRREQQQVMAEEQFLSRLSQLPVINTALTQLASAYEQTKTSNRILRYTLETAESGVAAVHSTAKPVMQKFEAPIGAVNHIACRQLDRLVCNYPIIAKPTDDVVQQTKEACLPYIKPTVDRVTAVRDYSRDKYNTIKEYGTNKVQAVSHYGNDAVGQVKQYSSRRLSSATQNAYAAALLAKVDAGLELTDKYIEHYLPEDVGITGTLSKLQEPSNTAARLGLITSKVQRRMYARAARRMHIMHARSQETLVKLTATLDVMALSKAGVAGVQTSLAGVQQKLADSRDGIRETTAGAWAKTKDIWQEVTSSEMPSRTSEELQTLERRLVDVAHRLTIELRNGFDSVLNNVRWLPGSIRQQLTSAKNSAQHLIGNFASARGLDEVPSHLIVEARNNIARVQESLGSALSSLVLMTPLSWMVMRKSAVDGDVSMEDMVASGIDNEDSN